MADTQLALNIAAAEAAAREETGLTDFGPEDFRTPLEHFVRAASDEAQLNHIGRMALSADVHRFLINRLRLNDDLRRHPEILDEDVSDPIVVTGLPRTGTSKLQRTLSSDPGVQRLDVWRLLNPAPFPGGDPDGPDPRIAAAHAIEAMLDNFPEFQAAHPTRAEEVDEDLLLHEGTFDSIVLTFRYRIPSYSAWVRARPVQPAYDYARRQLQYLQWQDGGRRSRPWVLKTPVHLGNLDAIAKCFPKATVVHCHRDPRSVIPSFARAVEASRAIGSDHSDPVATGAEQLELWADAMNRCLLQRTELKSSLTIVDVAYSTIRDDAQRAVEQVYAAAGRELTEAARKQMQQWAQENPQHRFGQHRYSIEDFGLFPEQIDDAFARYLSEFRELAVSGR